MAVVRRTATVGYKTECGKTGAVKVESDFLEDESYGSITVWFSFLARTTAARNEGVKFVTVDVTSLKLEKSDAEQKVA